MKTADDLNETLTKDFSSLSDENKKSVLEMTKFLVLAEKTIIPEMLQASQEEDEKKRKGL